MNVSIGYNPSLISIVMFHYIRDFQDTDYPEIKGLDVRAFEQQLEFFRKNFNVVTTEQVIQAFEGVQTLPERSLLLTFDDGYKDHYRYAFPLLQKYQMQGSFYPPAQIIQEKRVLDVNKIHFVLASEPNKQKIVASLRKLIESTAETESFESYWNAYGVADEYDPAEVIFIKRILQHALPQKIRLEFIQALFSEYIHVSEAEFSSELYLSTSEMQEMLNAGMHFGGHGFSHEWMSKMSEAEQTQEIKRSRDFLNDLGVDTQNGWSFCYPYGDYDQTSIKVLKEHNCQLALTTLAKFASLNASMRLSLPRLDTNDFPPKSETYLRR